MTGARLRFALALGLFLAWLGWLAWAYAAKDAHPIVSRGQLTAATHWVVADVTLGADGLPAEAITITQVLVGADLKPGGAITVNSLASALPPGAASFPGPGQYFLPLVADGRSYMVAGLPRSPRYEPQTFARPPIYPWTPATERQVAKLLAGRVE